MWKWTNGRDWKPLDPTADIGAKPCYIGTDLSYFLMPLFMSQRVVSNPAMALMKLLLVHLIWCGVRGFWGEATSISEDDSEIEAQLKILNKPAVKTFVVLLLRIYSFYFFGNFYIKRCNRSLISYVLARLAHEMQRICI